MNSKRISALLLGVVLLSLVGIASATFTVPVAPGNMFVKVIEFAKKLITTFKIVGGSFCLLMFVYGGARYLYSADDPGGRKQAISICIAAIIGGILIVLAMTITSPSVVPIPAI